MRNRLAAASTILLLLIGGCAGPWGDVLETDEVKKLKAEHTEPLHFKVAVGLHVDPAVIGRGPAEELAAIRDAAGVLANDGQSAAAEVLEASARGLESPKSLREDVERLLQDLKALEERLATAGQGEGAAAEKALEDLDKMNEKMTGLQAEIEAAKADESRQEPLMMKVPDAAADYQTFLSGLSGLNAALGDRLKTAEELFNKFPAAMEAMAEKNLDPMGETIGEIIGALDSMKEVLSGLAKSQQGLADMVFMMRRRQSTIDRTATNVAPGASAPLKAAWDHLKSAEEALQKKQYPLAGGSVAQGQKEFEEARTACEKAEKEGKGSATASLAQAPSRVAGQVEGLVQKVAAFIGTGVLADEEREAAFKGVQTRLETALQNLRDGVAAIEGKDLTRASTLCEGASAEIRGAYDVLLAEAEKPLAEAGDTASMPPGEAHFRDVIVKALQGFEMFDSVEALAAVPQDSMRANFLSAASESDADLLVLIEPRKNDIAYMGFNGNWYFSFIVWSFAWFASNCVPDETWESRLGLDVVVFDVRSQEEVYRKAFDSQASLNLSDIDDGYHFLGIVTGEVTKEDLKNAYDRVLPYHMNLITKDLLKEFSVDFKAYSAGPEFDAKRASAPPAGFGLVVGIGSYANDRFSGGAASAKGKLSGFLGTAESAAQVLDRVADALEAQSASEGAVGAIEGTDSVRKAARMLEMASTEFSANDHPVGVRSVAEALASLEEARGFLEKAEPRPAGADDALARLGSMLEALSKTDRAAQAFQTDAKFSDLGKKVGLLVPEADAIPATLLSVGEALADEGKVLVDAAPKIEAAVQALRDAESALGLHDLPTATRSLEGVVAAAGETVAAIEPLKSKAIEAAAVAGKLEFLKAETDKALAEARALEVPEALKALAADCDKVRTEAGALVGLLEAEEKKAEDRGKERKDAAGATRPAAATIREGAAKLREAQGLIDAKQAAEAGVLLGNAAKDFARAAESLAPQTRDIPTLVGEVLKTQEKLAALAESQAALVAKAEAGTPKKEDLADLPDTQRTVGQEVAKYADEMEAEIAKLEGEGKTEEAAGVKANVDAARQASGVLEAASQAFEMVDAPGAASKQQEGLEALEALGKALKELAPKVPAVGKHAFAVDGVVARQKAIMQQTRNVLDALQQPLSNLADDQDRILATGGNALKALRAIPATFPQGETEEPGVMAAVKSAGDDLDAALQRGAQASAMLRKGDTLGGVREQQNLHERLQALAGQIASAAEGKRSHVDWIKQVVADLESVRTGCEGAVGGLKESATRLDVDRAREDAASFAAYLTDRAGFSAARVTTLLGEEATREAVVSAFDGLLRNRVFENDLFVFYFAGVGGLNKGLGKDYDRFLFPYDADPDNAASPGITLEEIAGLIDGLGVKNAVLVFDSSFAPGKPKRGLGVLDGSEAKVDGGFVKGLLKRPGFTAIFAGGPSDGAGQDKSGKAGILTSVLIKGMRGDADLNKDRKTTVAELTSYLKREVAAAARETGRTQAPLIQGEAGRIAFAPSSR